MTRRAARPPRTCDAPGCDVQVRRGLLMCRPHWYALPRPLRAAINAAWKERRIRNWSANCLEARGYLARHPDPQSHQAELRDRLLGEHEECRP